MRKLVLACISAAAAVAAIVATVHPAAATPAGQSDRATPRTSTSAVQKVRVPMHTRNVVSVTRSGKGAVARLNDGRTLALSAQDYQRWKEHAAGGAHPHNVVSGDCGISWMYLFDYGSHNYATWTGYSVEAPVWFFEWFSVVNGAGNTYYEQPFYDNGGSNDGTWSTDHYGTVPAADTYEAAVDPPSYAFINTWQVCVSYGPFDDTYIS